MLQQTSTYHLPLLLSQYSNENGRVANSWLFLIMQTSLNPSQLEILRVMQHLRGEKDLAGIKSLLIAYLSDKVVRSADAAFDEKGYTAEILDTWKGDHFRKSA